MDILIDDKLLERFKNLVYTEEHGELEDNCSYELVDEGISKTIFDKQDIMVLLRCKSDKALKFLKLCYGMNYGVKIGNQYYIKYDDFTRFFDDFKGKEVAI